MVLKQRLGNVNIEDKVVIDVQEESAQVNRIVAGEGITISPPEGTGEVLINCTGEGAVVEPVLTAGVTVAKINDTPIHAYGLSGETFNLDSYKVGEYLEMLTRKLGGSIAAPAT